MSAIQMYFLQEKESLITELRKELRLSNEEHRELLGRVNADDVIRRIRSALVETNIVYLRDGIPYKASGSFFPSMIMFLLMPLGSGDK